MGKHIFIKNADKNNSVNNFKCIAKEEIEKNRISAYHSFHLNDLQLYELYCSIPLATIMDKSRIYPKYVKIIGRSITSPHPHRHFMFEEFIDCLNKDNDLKNVILQ